MSDYPPIQKIFYDNSDRSGCKEYPWPKESAVAFEYIVGGVLIGLALPFVGYEFLKASCVSRSKSEIEKKTKELN